MMSDKKSQELSVPSSSNSSQLAETKSLDADALRIAEQGYRPEMRQSYSLLSVLGLGFSLTNSWWAISAGLVAGINSGGPVLIVYGTVLLAIISVGVGITLSELASAYPNAGGQYFWARQLAPPRYANLMAYLTGWFAWAGSVFTSASVCLSMGSAMVGCYQLAHSDMVIQPWMVFVGYQATNVFAFIFNCHAKMLSGLSNCTLAISLLSFLIILIAVPSISKEHQDAEFVFATFVNNTGWKSAGMAFLLGLPNTNWGFACLDCATHIAEEVHQPERMIPKAILGTVAIGFVTSFAYSISMSFSMGDLTALTNTSTGVPILELFYQSLGNKAGAIVLEALVIATGIGCLCASHTWQSRLCWSFARDKGIPGHRWLSKVDKRVEVPLIAHIVSCVIVSILGCLYLGSTTAFNSMVTACIVLLYVSYSIPVVLLLLKRRGGPEFKRGPFWMGKIGFVSNIVLLLYTTFTIIVFSFPAVMPVAADDMNYVVVVYAVVAIIVTVDWFCRARKCFGHES